MRAHMLEGCCSSGSRGFLLLLLPMLELSIFFLIELRSMGALSQLSITHVMEAQGTSLRRALVSTGGKQQGVEESIERLEEGERLPQMMG